MTMPSVSDTTYDTPVQSPMNGSYKTQNSKEAGSFMSGAVKQGQEQVNGQTKKMMSAASGPIQHAVEGATAYVDQFKDQTSSFYNAHIKPNLPEPGNVVPDLHHLNANVNKFTAAVRDQIAHLDQNEIKEKYADLANQYYHLLLESYQHQLQEVQKNGGWKAVPSRAVEQVRQYASWFANLVADQAAKRPLVGFFTLVFASLAVVPLFVYATFSAATVITSAIVAVMSASVILGGAGLILGATLFFAAISAAIAAVTIAGSTFAYQKSKQAVRGLGAYAHREEEAGRIIATAEKGEAWVSARYTTVQNKAFQYVSQAQEKAVDAQQHVKQEASQHVKKRK